MEPQDGPLHLRGAQRHPHHRPPQDAGKDRNGVDLRARSGCRRGDCAVRGHQEAGPVGHPGSGAPGRHALCELPMAGRDAHQLQDHQPAYLLHEGAGRDGGDGQHRPASQEGAAAPAAGVRPPASHPGGRGGHGKAPVGGVRDRSEQRAHCGAGGGAAGHPGDRPGGFQLQPRRHRLRDPRQRRRHPGGVSDRQRDRFRLRGRPPVGAGERRRIGRGDARCAGGVRIG